MAMAAAPRAHADPIRIVALGDSLVLGSPSVKGRVPLTQAFPAAIERLLRERGWDVEVVNRGAIGDTAETARARIESAVPFGTTLTIVYVGRTDMPERVAVADVLEGMRALAHTVRTRGSDVLIVTNHSGPGLVTWTEGLRNVISYYPPPQHDSGDRAHLDGAGNEMIARRAVVDIEEVLKRRGLAPRTFASDETADEQVAAVP